MSITNPRKRDRTRELLIRTAMQAFAEAGVADASVQQIAARAGVANGTFYVHFRTKEEVLAAVAERLAVDLCERISQSQATIPEGAERMAIGNRRYIGLALEAPEQARLLLSVGAAAPELLATIARYPEADLRLGQRQGAFQFASRPAALVLVMGTVREAMQRALAGPVPRSFPSDIATMVLRALGVPPAKAEAIAKRPLPPLPTANEGTFLP
jgi:AcrR family transcriptional regulator